MNTEHFGDYTVLKELGQGSFGSVYLAEHRFLKKKYALKILSREMFSDSESIQRFEKDVSNLAAIDHPSVVKIHNISSFEGKYFIVMDPIVDSQEETITLEKFLQLRENALTEPECESILKQIASALDHAHQVKLEDDSFLYHGGLKLSNILIGKSDKNIRVYLTDFGLSRLIGDERVLSKITEDLHESLTIDPNFLDDQKSWNQHRSFIRNFSFLSPEQRTIGQIGDIRFKSDVFAFGVLTYFMITNKFPEGCFPFPSEIRSDFKLNWDHLIFRCLQPEPSKRPSNLIQTMEEVLMKDIGEKTGWNDIEESVENTMQMSFAFSQANKNASVEDSIAEKEFAFSATEEKSLEDLKPIIKPAEISRPQYEPDPGAIFQREMTVSRYEPKKIEVKEVEPIPSEMIVVPGSTYPRGSNHGARDEMPCHEISIPSFAIDVHPVTNEQFVRFLLAMGGEKDSNNNDIVRLRDSRIKRSGGKLIIESGYHKHPVVGVTWYGAVAYAKWVGKRLPTEAEWEIAAGSGTEAHLYPTGNTIERSQANFFSSDTTSVMSYPANSFGLYDVAGNVYEWCQDWYAYNYYDTSIQEPDNPKGPPQGVYRVLRGGCWKSLKEDLRCSHRHRNNPGAVNGTYGFRCATDVS